jgi:hypothetical protein
MARATAAAQAPDGPSNTQAFWQTLSKAHRSAAAEYPQNRAAKERWAAARMTSAHIKWALTTEPVGVSASEAASIVYDYALWRTDDLTPLFDKDWRSLGPDELTDAAGLLSEVATYLRRAIYFDSQRVPAYRDLAEVLRKSASLTSNWEEKQRILSEVRSSYEAFLRHGGLSDAAIERYLATPMPSPNVSVCESIEMETKAGRLGDYVSTIAEYLDTPWGRVNIETDNFWRYGPQYFVRRVSKPSVDIHVTGLYPPLAPGPVPLGLLGVLSWRDAVYIIRYHDLTHPISLKKVAKGKPIICTFNF